MTTRPRKASGGMSAIASTPSAAPCPVPMGGRMGTDVPAPRLLRWEDWYESASVAQRAEMLALTARQGFLFTNQFPKPTPETRNKTYTEDPSPVPALSCLFASQTADLTAVTPQKLAFIDQQLDAPQREAVARALCSPDVFLLQGLPGTGRSRVVAEILNQAAWRGQRTLFLAKHAASLDVVLRRLVQSEAVLALRFMGPGESAESLPSDVLPFTAARHQRCFIEQAQQKANAALAEALSRRTCRQAEEACWESLRRIADQMAIVRKQLEECTTRASNVAEDVRRDMAARTLAEPCASTAVSLERCYHDQLEALKTDLEANQEQRRTPAGECAEVEVAINDLLPLAQAKQGGRWWTRAWWRATFRGRVAVKMAELECRRQSLVEKLRTLERARQEVSAKCRRLEESFRASQAELLQTESDRRRQEESRRAAEHEREIERLDAAWRGHLDTLEMPDHRPAEPTHEAIEAAAACWEKQRRLDADAHQFADRWARYLVDARAQLSCRVAEWANVLAGTTAALSQDAAFAEAAKTPFDLLVLEQADQFTETELLELARHAPRWVLVAETHEALDVATASPPVAHFHGASGLLGSRLGGFQKLWQELHCVSRRPGYGWSWEDGRLCCTLRPLASQDRGHLEVERVADFPEIELRILSVPKAAPLLAQVAFPVGMTIKQAKDFIYRELEELAVQVRGGCAWLAEDAAGYILHLGPSRPEELECLELEPGLREWIAPATANTCRLEFARACGWTRARVDQWLARFLQMRDLGRTMALHVPHRMMAGLASPISDILFGGDYLAAPTENGPGALEFVAVPALGTDSKSAQPRKQCSGKNGLAHLPREGAGLEQDLTEQRSADRIPSELRATLPRRGFANFLEAQAVVRKLEELVTRADGNPEPIAVIALYEGQVALLRRLVHQSEPLRQRCPLLTIDLPGAFKEHEWPIVLVSLTRSHSHRAVPFGDRATDLAHALTRARRRLILFGDAGALVKRSQWQGPLDHLDAGAGALEGRRVTALLRWLADAVPKSPL